MRSLGRTALNLCSVSLLLPLALAGCGGEKDDFDASDLDDELAGEVKADSTTNRTVIKGGICAGVPIAGSFVKGKYAGYTFVADAGVKINLALDATDGRSDSVLMLYGPRNGNGTWPKRLAMNDDFGGSTDSRLNGVALRKAGTYLVIAGEYRRAAGTFELRLDVASPATGNASDPSCKPAVGLSLVKARDHIDGAFLTPATVAADATRIYLASRGNGKLFVLARDRAAGFPLVETIEGDGTRLTSITNLDQELLVTTETGVVRVYRKGSPLTLVTTQAIAPRGFSSHGAWTGNTLLVGDGSAAMAGNSSTVFVSPLNEEDGAVEIRSDLSEVRRYYPAFDQYTTTAFDRATGQARGTLKNPLTLGGTLGGVSIYADETTLALFIAGCCGPGVSLYDARTLAPRATIDRSWANAVSFHKGYLVIGGEDGGVDLWDVAGTTPRRLASVDLRQLTGHTGIEDIEIRAVWTDNYDDLIFAGSSWGNDQSRSLDLPSFFVLEMTGVR
ncbi:MAG: hypothetical protein HY698_08015 [Deltaproteobacteria bacterium]|nr:hypothetical protein [Deltaproteobacteria bacterium]